MGDQPSPDPTHNCLTLTQADKETPQMRALGHGKIGDEPCDSSNGGIIGVVCEECCCNCEKNPNNPSTCCSCSDPWATPDDSCSYARPTPAFAPAATVSVRLLSSLFLSSAAAAALLI